MKIAVAQEWFKYALSRISDYQGRAGRVEYASFCAGQVLMLCICVGLDKCFSSFPAFTAVYLALTFVPSCMLVVRRLHDCGYTGRWAVPMVIFFPALLFLLFIPSDPSEPNAYGYTERLIYREKKPHKFTGSDPAMVDYVDPEKAIEKREEERQKVQDEIKKIEKEEAAEAESDSARKASK